MFFAFLSAQPPKIQNHLQNMKTKQFPLIAASSSRITLPALATALFALAGSAGAVPLYLNATNPTWDTTLTNWSTASSGTGTTWTNSGNIANLNGAGTVNLASSVSVNGLNFLKSETIAGTNNITLSANPVSVASGKNGIISVPIAGSNGLSLTGGGTLVLKAVNTYSGTTTIQSGSSVKIDTTGTLGSGPVTDNGNLQFVSGTGITPVDNAISGSGTVSVSLGITTFTGSNNYSGTTTIDPSTTVLNIGNAGNTGSLGTGNVINNGTLNFKRTDNYGGNVSNAISGVAGIVNVKAGNLTLTGGNSYGGGTNVSAGSTLLVNNTSGSGTGSGLVTVYGGASMGGTGTIGGDALVSGTLSPGANSAIGKLTINGNFSFDDNSTFAYDMNSASHTGDLAVVNGTDVLSIGANVELTLNDLGSGTFAPGTILSLIQYEGTWDGGLFTYNHTQLNDGDVFTDLTANHNHWTINYNGSMGDNVSTPGTNYISLSLTAVPEVGGLLAIGCLVGSGAFFRSRRRGTNLL